MNETERAQARHRFRTEVLRGRGCLLRHTECLVCDGEGWREDPVFVCTACDGTGVHRCEGRVEAHHIVRQVQIRNNARPEDRDKAQYDERNGVPLCRRVHELVTGGAIQLPKDMLPISVWPFAEDFGLTWCLEKEYRFGAWTP